MSDHAHGRGEETISITGRLSWTHLLVLVIALCLLVAAQTRIITGRDKTAQSKILFTIGLCLIWGAIGVERGTQERSAPAVGLPALRPTRQALVRGALLASALLAALSAVYSAKNVPHPDAVPLWLLSLCLFAVAVAARVVGGTSSLASAREGSVPRRARVAASVLLVGIVGLGLWMRTTKLADIPAYIHEEEVYNIVEDRRLLNGEIPFFGTGYCDQTGLAMIPGGLFLQLPGDPVLSLRLSSVLLGILSVPLVYLLARQFVGQGAALLAAFLMAVAALDIHFSRMAVINFQAAPLSVAAMYLLLRTLRRQSALSAVGCGIVTGLSAYAYMHGRIIPVAVAATLLAALVRDRQHWRVYARLGAIIVLCALIVAAPQLGFYVSRPEEIIGKRHFWWDFADYRLQSGMTLREQVLFELDHTIWGYTSYADRGWHYVPGLMIHDVVTGILFFIGLVVCVRRFRDLGSFMLLSLYVACGVIINFLPGQAPHSPRILIMTPTVCLLAAIGAERIRETAARYGPPWRAIAGLMVFAVVPVAALWLNGDAIFRQSAAFQTDHFPTLSARYLQRHAPSVIGFIMGQDWEPRSSPVQVLAPGSVMTAPTLEEFLPLRGATDKDVAFFFSPRTVPALTIVRSYYPNGVLAEQRRADGRLALSIYTVANEDVSAWQGIVGVYTGSDGSQTTRRDKALAFEWERDRPEGIVGPWKAQWRGALYAPEYGLYTLRLEGDGAGQMSLDGAPLLQKGQEKAASEIKTTLARGLHVLDVEYVGSGGAFRLVWARPGRQAEVIEPPFFVATTDIRGLHASYYAGAQVSGQPVYEAIEPALFGRFTSFQMTQGVRPYAARWSAVLTVRQAGPHTFGVRAYNGVFDLRLDGNVVVSTAAPTNELRQSAVTLDSGEHTLELTYRLTTGETQALELWWAPPGQELSPIPPAVLRPRR